MSALTQQLEGSVAIERAKAGLEMQATPNAMQLIQSAIAQGSSIDTIERLAALQREMVEYQAKVEFNEAMQRVQQKMGRISADATNSQTNSKYATYGKLDSILRPLYAAEGFSLSFNTADSRVTDSVRVLCDVARGGYVKTYQIDMPADGKGAKGGDVMTKTHATGAASQYGMRYLLKMIFNVAIGEGDKDGNMPGREMDVDEFERIKGLIENAPHSGALKEIYMSALKAAESAGDPAATKAFVAATAARKKDLA